MTQHECSYCEPRLRALADRELHGDEEKRLRQHLAHCSRCSSAFASVSAVSALVAALPGEIEPPPHFGPNLQLRLSGLRPKARQPVAGFRRWRRGFSLAGATFAAMALAFTLGTPRRLRAQDLVGRVQESWQRLQSYSCRFVTEGLVAGRPRHFVESQWFRKPDLFRLETDKHYPERTYVERDRVTTYIPGASWLGKRIAITRPRHAREEGLPFPFGADWPISYDITMDALVREIRFQEGAELLGTQEVQGKLCYGLKFHVQHPGDRLPTHYLVWVDPDSFLPLKMKIYRDTANHTESSAVDLQTNALVPSDTFHFEPGPDTFHIFGEVEPFVFTLGMAHPRPPSFDADPTGSARAEIGRRAAALPCTSLAPGYMTEGYVFVRARAASGRWLDAYWINDRSGMVIKLLEQPVSLPVAETEEGVLVSLPGTPERQVRWREARQPFRLQYLTWEDDNTRLSLTAAGISRKEALRIAASMSPSVAAPRLEERVASGQAWSGPDSPQRHGDTEKDGPTGDGADRTRRLMVGQRE